jgi:hypothetical protein
MSLYHCRHHLASGENMHGESRTIEEEVVETISKYNHSEELALTQVKS